jgi:S1-C subfamily serine protease
MANIGSRRRRRAYRTWRQPLRFRILGLVACGALVLGACSLEPILGEDDTAAPSPSVELEQNDVAPPPSEIADVVEEVLPTVVNVRVQTASGQAQGSGVIIERGGVILTNHHVVEQAEEIRVVFNDDEHEPAEADIVGAVPERDLAVIKVDAADLLAIELGRSSRLRLGDSVLAIGAPLGLGASVTQGIISGEARTIDVDGPDGPAPPLEGLLQTDAAINPGNSGGALVNLSGQLVGINTATANPAFAENTGFAIAIDSAVPLIEQILSGREQGFMGVALASDAEFEGLAAEFGYPEGVEGALIVQVQPDSPAEEAGIEEGEIVVGIDDEDIHSADDLIAVVTRHQPGDQVRLDMLTPDGDRRSVTLELAARPRTQLNPEN